MSKLITLEDYKESWFPARCLCVNCSHIWKAVVHEDRQDRLECPSCGEFKGAVVLNLFICEDW